MDRTGVGAEQSSIKPLFDCAVVCSVGRDHLGSMQAALVLTITASALLSALAQKPHHCSKSSIMKLSSLIVLL